MSARTKARKRALDVLYVADIRGESIPATLAVEQQRAAAEPDRQASWQYAREIAEEIKRRGIVERISGRHAARLLKRGISSRTESATG